MLYLLKSNHSLKIGTTSNLKSRLSTYKTHNPDIELLDACEGDLKEETEIHSLLKNFQYKKRKEWFVECKEVYSIWNKFKVELEKRKEQQLYNENYINKFIDLVKEDENLEIYNRDNDRIYNGMKEWALATNATYEDFCKLYFRNGSYDFLFPEESIVYMNRKCFENDSLRYKHYNVFNNILNSVQQNVFLENYDSIKNQIFELKHCLKLI